MRDLDRWDGAFRRVLKFAPGKLRKEERKRWDDRAADDATIDDAISRGLVKAVRKLPTQPAGLLNLDPSDPNDAKLGEYRIELCILREARQHLKEQRQAREVPLSAVANDYESDCVGEDDVVRGLALPHGLGTEDEALENVSRDRTFAALYAAVELLPEDEYEVLWLRYWGKLTERETADKMGTSKSRVRRLCERAYRELAQYESLRRLRA